MTEQKRLSTEQQTHYNGWRHSWLVLAVGLFLVLIAFWVVVRNNSNKQDETAAVTNCRGRVAALVTSAQVDNQLAQNTNDSALDDLVVTGLTQRSADLTVFFKAVAEAKVAMDKTGVALSEARDRRNAFEEHPTGAC